MYLESLARALILVLDTLKIYNINYMRMNIYTTNCVIYTGYIKIYNNKHSNEYYLQQHAFVQRNTTHLF
jgi:hypothetical protein